MITIALVSLGVPAAHLKVAGREEYRRLEGPGYSLPGQVRDRADDGGGRGVARAQEWIETVANEGFPCYSLFETDPFLERLRGSPRLRSLLTALRKEREHIPGEAG